jgi:hypothetical protein
MGWAKTSLPFRLGNEGLWANFFGGAFLLPADTVSQARVEAILARCQNEDISPDDILGLLAQEAGLEVYPGETPTALRERINEKWGFWAGSGLDPTIISEIQYFVTTQGSSAAVNIWFNPIPSGGHPEWNIQNWPADPSWWSQIIVTVDLAAAIGSGAESRSVLVDDTQLNIIQSLIRKLQPADFVVREIVLRQGLSSPSGVWDDPTLSWDPGVNWDPPSGSVIVEQFRAF